MAGICQCAGGAIAEVPQEAGGIQAGIGKLDHLTHQGSRLGRREAGLRRPVGHYDCRGGILRKRVEGGQCDRSGDGGGVGMRRVRQRAGSAVAKIPQVAGGVLAGIAELQRLAHRDERFLRGEACLGRGIDDDCRGVRILRKRVIGDQRDRGGDGGGVAVAGVRQRAGSAIAEVPLVAGGILAGIAEVDRLAYQSLGFIRRKAGLGRRIDLDGILVHILAAIAGGGQRDRGGDGRGVAVRRVGLGAGTAITEIPQVTVGVLAGIGELDRLSYQRLVGAGREVRLRRVVDCQRVLDALIAAAVAAQQVHCCHQGRAVDVGGVRGSAGTAIAKIPQETRGPSTDICEADHLAGAHHGTAGGEIYQRARRNGEPIHEGAHHLVGVGEEQILERPGEKGRLPVRPLVGQGVWKACRIHKGGIDDIGRIGENTVAERRARVEHKRPQPAAHRVAIDALYCAGAGIVNKPCHVQIFPVESRAIGVEQVILAGEEQLTAAIQVRSQEHILSRVERLNPGLAGEPDDGIVGGQRLCIRRAEQRHIPHIEIEAPGQQSGIIGGFHIWRLHIVIHQQRAVRRPGC